MPIKVGNRTFAPRPFTTLLTIALIALLLSLGRWQLHRADEKRVLETAVSELRMKYVEVTQGSGDGDGETD